MKLKNLFGVLSLCRETLDLSRPVVARGARNDDQCDLIWILDRVPRLCMFGKTEVGIDVEDVLTHSFFGLIYSYGPMPRSGAVVTLWSTQS